MAQDPSEMPEQDKETAAQADETPVAAPETPAVEETSPQPPAAEAPVEEAPETATGEAPPPEAAAAESVKAEDAPAAPEEKAPKAEKAEKPAAPTAGSAPTAKTPARDWVKEVEQRYMKESLPKVEPGDSVKVKIKIKEGNKERIQAYEGVIIKVRGGGINKTITVRRVFQGVGVERVFLLHSPKVESIDILRKGRVRRAKLYYLRALTGKAARIREKVVTTSEGAGKGKGKKGKANQA